VDASRPWKNVAELTGYLKDRRDKASYATTNPPAKVMGAIYKARAGLQAVEVPYRTAFDTVNDMQSGALDYALFDPVFATTQAREGRMRILAVSTGERTKANPELPTMAESGVAMDLLGWFAAMVPMGTPRPIVDQLNMWFNKLDATGEAKTFLNSIGGDPWITTPDEGQARLPRDVEAWGEHVRTAHIEPQGARCTSGRWPRCRASRGCIPRLPGGELRKYASTQHGGNHESGRARMPRGRGPIGDNCARSDVLAGGGLSQPGLPLRHQFPPWQRRRRVDALLCRESACAYRPYRHRRKQVGRQRGNRSPSNSASEPRRLHQVSQRGQRRRRADAPVQGSPRQRSQGVSARSHDQPAGIHADGRCENAVHECSRAHGCHEAEGQSRDLRDRRDLGHNHGRDVQVHHWGGGRRGALQGFLGRAE